MIDNRIPQLNPTGIAHSHVVQSFGTIKEKGALSGALYGSNSQACRSLVAVDLLRAAETPAIDHHIEHRLVTGSLGIERHRAQQLRTSGGGIKVAALIDDRTSATS